MDDILEHGPLMVNGVCSTVDVPYRELALAEADVTQISLMNIRDQFRTWLELQSIADNEPLELGYRSLSQVEGIFPQMASKVPITKSLRKHELLQVVPYKPKPAKSRRANL